MVGVAEYTESLCDHRVSGGNRNALFNDILKLGTWETAECMENEQPSLISWVDVEGPGNKALWFLVIHCSYIQFKSSHFNFTLGEKRQWYDPHVNKTTLLSSYRTVKTDIVRRPSTASLFRRGSTFRFSGRTQFKLLQDGTGSKRPSRRFER